MRTYIFLCLMFWVRSGYFNLSSKSKPRNLVQNKKPCLEFSKINVKNTLVDLLRPELKVILLLYSRKNLNCAEPLFEHNNSLNINFNTQKKTVWIIHGYRLLVGSTPSWLEQFQSTLLSKEDMNVIVVDWNRGATTFIYSRAVRNVRVVAESLSKTIRNLVKHGASLDSFHFIGMSLGAHVSGFVGKNFGGQIGRITGLDPAAPKFARKPPNMRLDYTDAKFVDVIHSDAEGLGIKEPLGHIDFYPNGGKTQPGCPKSLLSGMKYFKCEHQRATSLFLASFQTKCNFISFPCGSYKDYKKSLCMDCGMLQQTSCPRLGYKAELWKESLQSVGQGWPLRTMAFLDTSDKYPFCVYYFVLSIIPMDATMNNGSIMLKILNQHGKRETAKLYEKNKPFAKFQEVKILVKSLSDMANISSICLMYSQDTTPSYDPKYQYRIHSLVLKSLTYPERPAFCRYNIVLKEKQEVILQPDSCKENNSQILSSIYQV